MLSSSKFDRRQFLGASLGAVASIAAGTRVLAATEHNYILSTASTGGTFYPVGVALATLTQVKLQPSTGIKLSVINSAGSGENVHLLDKNEAQFAIIQSLYGYFARTGTGPIKALGPQSNLRAVTMLWTNVEHPIIRKEFVKSGTISDFANVRGKRVSLGRQNSGTLGSNTVMLKNLGYRPEQEFDQVHIAYGATVDAFMNGQIDGAIIGGGVPVGSVTRLMASASDAVSLLEYTPEEAKAADGGLGTWAPYTIPAGTYPGQDTPIRTIGTPNLLVCNADVPDEHVYNIIKAIYTNAAFLQSIHSATKEMDLQRALTGVPLPVHPGAEQFLREAGAPVPALKAAD
ncbi:TAXI family TRAP transporter solute-binding subunit [Stappia indica]|uniref:TAXI family TRAP transporter solute-binding subunit n=1 Tax=Stappia indica TaxID=538381 RepID=UPI001CD4DDA9|nr:TAXI family TRAP transporter solute-binding subunit [Stappia indica]MCA1298081.1 TAXI family TRAP transporter solute-binding subunit [Stappia indica]